MSKTLIFCLATLAALLSTPAAMAHKPSDSYLTVTVSEDSLAGRWDIALRDLDYAIGLDGNDDGAITWGEVKARHKAIAAYALARLDLSSGATPCALDPTGNLIAEHSDGAYAVLAFRADCDEILDALRIGYRLFFDLDPQHRGLLQVETAEGARAAIFSPENSVQDIALGEAGAWQALAAYLVDGAWHIWIGYDHILFLLTLLLPSVLRRREGRWLPAADFCSALISVAKIVTSFTLAHSITLGLAAFEVVALPTRLVESVIALSVIVAAANNIRPVVTDRLWLVAFGFGLIHGFGFASVLADLGLPGETLLAALLGFNLGVELGQLAIAAAFLPLAYLLRQRTSYPRFALPLGSAAVAAVAGLWLAERALNLDLPLV